MAENPAEHVICMHCRIFSWLIMPEASKKLLQDGGASLYHVLENIKY